MWIAFFAIAFMGNGNRKSCSRVHAPVSAFIGSVKIPLNLRYSPRSRYKDSRGTERKRRGKRKREAERIEKREKRTVMKRIEGERNGSWLEAKAGCLWKSLFLASPPYYLDGPDTKIIKSVHNSG